MALPANNAPWPPKPWDVAYSQYTLNEAWHLGDVDTLTKVYQGSNAQRPTHVHEGQAHTGGVVGKLTRFFWGRPVPLTQNRTRLHLPAPSDLATLSSDLMFAEPPEVRLPDSGEKGKNRALQDRLDLLANGPDAHAVWNTMGELKSVFGAAAIVTRWDRETSDRPWLQVQAADVLVPEYRDGRLIALTLWSEWTEGQTVYRHLERHESGAIEHALYKGTTTVLGRRVPLQDQERTEHLAATVNADGLVLTGIKRLTASYNINMPTRAWRKQGVLAEAGRSDFASILPLFDTLDEVWSSWVRDIRLARARLIVPESYLEYSGPGNAAQLDPDQEIFAPVAAMYRPGEKGIELHQPAIRVDDHERTLYAVYREILRAAGYAQSSWGEYNGNGGQMTATEVNDRDKASERTRDKKALYDRRAIAEQAAVLLDIDAEVYGGASAGDMPVVTFPPASQVDPEKNSRTIQNLRAATVMTVRTGVETAHPDWDEERVGKEVDGLLAERPASPDPSTFTGL